MVRKPMQTTGRRKAIEENQGIAALSQHVDNTFIDISLPESSSLRDPSRYTRDRVESSPLSPLQVVES